MASRNTLILLTCLVLVLLLGAPGAIASSACVNGSLSTYAPATSASSPISCQYMDLIFTFSFGEFVYQKDPSQPNLSPGDRIENHVNISFINPSTGVEGLLLSPTTDYLWFGAGGNAADVNFTYALAVATPAKYLKQATFDVDATISGPSGGGILAGETICCPNGSNSSPLSLQLTVNQFGTGVGTDSAYFARPQTAINANKDLLIASIGPGDLTLLNSFDQTFQVGDVPEPGVWMLTAGGLGLMLLKRRKWFGRSVSAAAVGCIAAACASASPLCTDTATLGGNTLDKYIAAGSCTINNTLFTFSGGTYTYNFSGGVGLGNSIAPSAVTVQPQTSLTDPGFQFIGQWAVSGGQTGALTMQFTASAPAGFSIDSATFTTTTSKSGAGAITGSSTVTNGVLPVGYTFPSGGVPIPLSPASFGAVTLTAVINLSGNGTGTLPSRLVDNAHLSNLVVTTNVINGTPEPVSMLLLGSGLLAISLVGRKKLFTKK